MEQIHIKALAALEPFIVLATTTKSPSHRFIAENINRATSAPGTYVFTELLQTPAVQSLRSADTPAEYRAWLTHLEIFSYGTFEEYQNTPNLPPLTPDQSTKLRQLTLLTLASSPTTPLTYTNLLKSLSLPTPSTLESLITTSMYTGLLTARLSPTSTPPTVHLTSVAPLRDLRPMSLPSLLHVLSTWSSRCDAVVTDLEAQITAVKTSASSRQRLAKRRQDTVDGAVTEAQGVQRADPFDVTGSVKGHRQQPGHQAKGGIKRDLDEAQEGEGGEYPEFDDFEEGTSGGDEVGGGRMDVDVDLSAGGMVGNGGGGAAGHGGGPATRGNKKSRGKGL